METLTKQNQTRYQELKQVVKENLESLFKVAEAMKEIKEDKLYREEFTTWEDFCQSAYHLSVSYVDRMIDGYVLLESLPKNLQIGETSIPIEEVVTNESQVRSLKKVPKDKRIKVLIEAASSSKPITSKSIKKAAKAVADKDRVLDAMGYPIPIGCVELWRMAHVLHDILNSLRKMKLEIVNGIAEDNPVFRMVPKNVTDQLSRILQQIQESEPYAVCLTCSGTDATKDHCSTCRGTGLISRFAYEMKTDKKLKMMREAQLKGKTK